MARPLSHVVPEYSKTRDITAEVNERWLAARALSAHYAANLIAAADRMEPTAEARPALEALRSAFAHPTAPLACHLQRLTYLWPEMAEEAMKTLSAMEKDHV